jgi:antitoxin CcdA
MPAPSESEAQKRRPVNLTIREDVLKEAKALNLNASKAAECGILAAIRETRAEEWLRSNKKALQAHNERVEGDGTLLKPVWLID